MVAVCVVQGILIAIILVCAVVSVAMPNWQMYDFSDYNGETYTLGLWYGKWDNTVTGSSGWLLYGVSIFWHRRYSNSYDGSLSKWVRAMRKTEQRGF